MVITRTLVSASNGCSLFYCDSQRSPLKPTSEDFPVVTGQGLCPVLVSGTVCSLGH